MAVAVAAFYANAKLQLAEAPLWRSRAVTGKSRHPNR